MPKGSDSQITNQIAALRQKRGISVSELAQLAGVTRQAVHAMETGTYVPNTAIALRLARVLQCNVEQLFTLEERSSSGFRTAAVELLEESVPRPGQTIQLARVGERLVAATPSPVAWYIPAADGILTAEPGRAQVFEPSQKYEKRVLIAGCDPGISVLARHLLPAGVELVMIHRNSAASLGLLGREMIHIAGTHLRDQRTGEENIPAVRNVIPSGSAALVSYAVWEQGICTAPGNPKGIASLQDFARPDVRIVNREAGAGTRMFLARELARLGIPTEHVRGYDHIVEGHLPAAWHVFAGLADACVATAAAARAFGLDFKPLAEERYDLALTVTTLGNPLVESVFDTLSRASFRKELETLGGYHTSVSGKRIL